MTRIADQPAMRIPPLLTIAALLTAAAQPGARVRVDFDRDGVTGTRASGPADPATGRATTADDPVRVASISKLVVALGVMRLVEQGRLDLDADVSKVLGWRLRQPAHPDVPITLRMLLSHRSGLRDGIDYVLPLGVRVRDALAAPGAWDRDHAPGTYFAYANIGFPVIATVMETATGERFDRLMQRLVFAPLKLDACYNWTTCSDAAIARAVELRGADGAVRRDDLHGVRPVCPVATIKDGGCDLAHYRIGENGALFSPQGGLRISAKGLATIGRVLLEEGRVDGRRFLSARSVAAIVGPVWSYDGGNGDTEDGFWCGYGLALQHLGNSGCRDDPFGDGRRRIGHSGEAYGLRSGLFVDPTSETGTAWFVIAIPDGERPGRSAFGAEVERLIDGP